MSWKFEDWESGRFLIHRDENGKFSKGTRHYPKEWKDNHKKAHNTNETKLKHRNINLGRKHSEKTKLKLSKKQKGNKYALGYKHTEETKRLMSIQRKGRVPWNKGKEASEESKKKMSISHIGKKLTDEHKGKVSFSLIGNKRSLGFKHSKETREKMSKAKKGCIPWNKGISWNKGEGKNKV